MDLRVDAIAAQPTYLDKADAISTPAKTGEIGSFISSSIESLNQMITSSEASSTAYALGENVSTHDLMISMEKARFSMQLAVEVRNRLLEAYQELVRMQI